MAVIILVSVVRDIALSGALFILNLPTNSAAKCCASDAEPPFPQKIWYCPQLDCFYRFQQFLKNPQLNGFDYEQHQQNLQGIFLYNYIFLLPPKK